MRPSSLTLEDIQNLSEEISHLVRAGMPLEECLASAGRGRGQRLQRLTRSISDQLNQGRSLTEIVGDRSMGVPGILTAAVGAGVQSGDLGLTVEMMGNLAGDVIELRSRLLSSAAYPLTILAVAALLVVLVIQHALEEFREAIISWNIKVSPILIQLLEWNSQTPAWTLLLPLFGVLLVVFWMLSGRASAMTFRGPEKLFLLLPGVGALIRDLRFYTLSRMLSLLIDRGLPLHDALVLAGGVSGSRRLERACRDSAAGIRQDGTVAESTAVARSSSGNSLPSLLQACLKQVEHDERRLVHRLQSVGEFYRNRLERNSAWVKLLMPVVMFIIIGGGCVFAYSMMVFWPVSELYRNLGK